MVLLPTWTKVLITVIVIAAVAGLGFWIYKQFLEPDVLKKLKDSAQEVFEPGALVKESGGEIAENLDSAEIVRWTNEKRSEDGKNSLSVNSQLSEAALVKANDILERQYFEHVAPDGRDVANLVQEQGYSYSMVGENLALGDFESEEDLVNAWMESDGHRENILREGYAEIGVAAIKGEYEGNQVWVAVQTFGRPAPNCTMPDKTLKDQIEKYESQYDTADSLVSEYNSLVAEGQSLIERGNAKVKKGNKIANETESNEQAQVYWDEGERLQNQGQAKMDEADKVQKEIEEFEYLYDQVENLVDRYNEQVEAYNRCIEQ